MRVAAVTNRNVPGFPDENLLDHLAWIKKAARENVRLLLFPELSLSGYSHAPFMPGIAMGLENKRIKRIAAAAREHGMFISFGFPLRKGKKIYISQALAGPRGILGHYEKVHLAGERIGEGEIFSPGDTFRVFKVDGVGVGINICFDGRHPAPSACLSHLGAEIILHPHGNGRGRLGVNPADWVAKKRAYLGARAVDTCTYTLICNSIGDVRDKSGAKVSYSGGALILGPEGEFINRSKSTARRPHMVLADLDIEALRKLRSTKGLVQSARAAYLKAFSKDVRR
jgi:predicted amidohydrolase